MKQLSKFFIVFALVCVSAAAAYSQNCNSYLQQATELVSQEKYCDAINYYQKYSSCNADADVSTEIEMCKKRCKLSGGESTPEPVVGNPPDYTSAPAGKSSPGRSSHSAATGNAQRIKFGVTAGLNLSNMVASDEHTTETADIKVGLQLGLVAEYSLNDYFAIAPELLFAQRGSKSEAKEEGVTYTETTTLNYLQLPINALYKFNIADDSKFLVFAGPYLGYGLSGTAKSKWSGDGESGSESGDIKFGSGDDKNNAFDFGLNVGVGYQYTKFFVKAQYNLGLGNLSNDNDYSVKNTNIGISVGYLF